MGDVKHPEIEVQLSGEDGNALAIVGRVRRAMKKAGLPAEECNIFSNEALSGDYDHVLSTCARWVTVL